MPGSRSTTALRARVATFVLLIGCALATDVPRGAAPSYIVTDLGTFGTVQSAEAFELNNANQVVGRAANRPFLWQNNVKTDLGSLQPGPSAIAYALNEAAEVVGVSTFAPASAGRAVLWKNGLIRNLTPDIPSTQGSSATGINEGMQIVGNIGYSVAFLWEDDGSPAGKRTTLPHLGGGGTYASDINDSGIVVGASYTADMTPMGLMQHPFKWDGVRMTDLGLLPGDQDGGAAAINSAGRIVGSSGTTDPDTYESRYKAFLWDGVMTALPVPSTEAYAGDINEAGVVVGSMRAGGAVSNFHAWIYQDGTVTNLNHLIPQGGGLHIAYGNAINDEGQIAATAYDAQGHYHAVLLTPSTAPPPAPGITIFDVALNEGQNGTATAIFYVRLSFASAGDVTVAYSTANGTATAGTDYDARSGTLTIPAGQSIGMISVPIKGDRKREPDEVFYVNLKSPVGSTLVDGQAAGTLRNDDR